MSWGTGSYGVNPYGAGVSNSPPVTSAAGPSELDVLGGDILVVTGSDFFTTDADPIQVRFMQSGQIKGTGFLFDPFFDLNPTRAIVGSPALPAGVYDLRVDTGAGQGSILASAVTYKVMSEEVKVHQARAKWASLWNAGPRLLR